MTNDELKNALWDIDIYKLGRFSGIHPNLLYKIRGGEFTHKEKTLAKVKAAVCQYLEEK